MLSDAEKKLLAWALDCALTERQKVSVFKMSTVLATAKKALEDPAMQEKVIEIVSLFDVDKAKDIRSFLHRR